MRMPFKVAYEDGREIESVAKPKDIVAFERQYGESIVAFTDERNPPRFEWIAYLAWSPLHRQGREPRAFDEFLDVVDDIEEIDEAQASEEGRPADPFPSTPSDDPSPA